MGRRLTPTALTPPSDEQDLRAYVERLEWVASLHPDFVWATYLTGAAAVIRELAELDVPKKPPQRTWRR